MTWVNKHDEGDAPFNMAVMFYYRLNELLSIKDKNAIEGDLNAYYQCLITVYNNVYFQIQLGCEDDLAEINILIDEIERLLYAPIPNDKRLAQQIKNSNNNQARLKLLKLDRLLMVAMDKKKMIFPRVEVQQGISALRKKLGLTEK